MKFQLIYIALTFIALTSVCDGSVTPCPRNDGFFAIPNDCSKFLHCLRGTPRVATCPTGYHFSTGDLICEVPEKAKCPNICDSKHGELLPHPTNCAQFYHCDNGKAVLKDCGGGTHFNPKSQVCDWPRNAGCVSKSN